MKKETAARKVEGKNPGGRPKKQVAKLVVARDKAERKVTKLRNRLVRAESKLAQRTGKLDVAGSKTAQAVPSVVEAAPPAAKPMTASASPSNVPYEKQREAPAAPANKRRSPHPRPTAAHAAIPAVKTREVPGNSHVKVPASPNISQDGESGVE